MKFLVSPNAIPASLESAIRVTSSDVTTWIIINKQGDPSWEGSPRYMFSLFQVMHSTGATCILHLCWMQDQLMNFKN